MAIQQGSDKSSSNTGKNQKNFGTDQANTGKTSVSNPSKKEDLNVNRSSGGGDRSNQGGKK